MCNLKRWIAGKAGQGYLLSLLRLVLVGFLAFGATPTVLASSANAGVARAEYRDFSVPLNFASVHSELPVEFVKLSIEAEPFWTASRVAWVMGAITIVVLLASFGWRYHSVARLNRRLSRQAAILRAVLGNVDQGISLFDGDLKSVAFNDRFIELLDLPLELNQTNVPYEDYLRCVAERGEYGTGDIEQYVQDRMDLALQFKPRQFVRQRPNGKTIDIRRNPIPEGGFVTTYTDITDRMRVEDALRFSEHQLSEAQRIGRIGHWRYFPVLNSFECSEAFYQIYGWDFKQAKATFSAITAAVHPEDKERVAAVRKDAGIRRIPFVCEFRILRPDGEIRCIKGEGRPEFDAKGQLVSFFGVNQDITEQKRAEQELLRERTRAEMANLAKSEFLANMSHEIRTPLNAIIGFADIMNQRVFGSVGNERYTEYVSDIHSSARHLLDLVNDILDISTIEAGELTLSPTELNVSEIFEECTRFVREQAREAEVDLTASLCDPQMMVHADHRAVRQILLNLLSNAIKFTPAGGSVTMSASETDEMFSMVVADTGVGIPAAELPKVTQPFETGNNNPHTLKKGNPHVRSEGTGLGLAIVQSLAELHGGDLEIESSDGKGTVVRICFPRSRRIAA